MRTLPLIGPSRALPFVAIALVAAACSAEDDENTATEDVPRTASGELATAVHDDPVELEQRLDIADSELIGLHFAVALGATERAPALDVDRAAELGLPGAIHPEDGHDVLLVQWATDYDREPIGGLQPNRVGMQFSIESGDQVIDVDGHPEPGELWALTVPADMQPRLAVVDTNATFRLDLTTGERIDHVPGITDPTVLEGTSRHSYEDELAFSAQNLDIHGEGPLHASFEVRREAWQPAPAYWPEDGELWYVVDVNLLTYWHFEDDEESWLSWFNKPEHTLTLTFDGTTVEPAHVDELECSAGDGDQFCDHVAMFSVPADADDVRLRFEPGGNGFVNLPFAGDGATITSMPPAAEFSIDFTD